MKFTNSLLTTSFLLVIAAASPLPVKKDGVASGSNLPTTNFPSTTTLDSNKFEDAVDTISVDTADFEDARDFVPGQLEPGRVHTIRVSPAGRRVDLGIPPESGQTEKSPSGEIKAPGPKLKWPCKLLKCCIGASCTAGEESAGIPTTGKDGPSLEKGRKFIRVKEGEGK